jgi:hypothetical protein
MEKDKEENVCVATRITKAMKQNIERVLATDGHLNTADYMRDLIRKDLERRALLVEA